MRDVMLEGARFDVIDFGVAVAPARINAVSGSVR